MKNTAFIENKTFTTKNLFWQKSCGFDIRFKNVCTLLFFRLSGYFKKWPLKDTVHWFLARFLSGSRNGHTSGFECNIYLSSSDHYWEIKRGYSRLF